MKKSNLTQDLLEMIHYNSWPDVDIYGNIIDKKTKITEASTTKSKRLGFKQLCKELDYLWEQIEKYGVESGYAINDFDATTGNQAEFCSIGVLEIKDLNTGVIYSFDKGEFTVPVYTFIVSSFSDGSYTSDVFYDAIEFVDKYFKKYSCEVLKYDDFCSDDFDIINNIDDDGDEDED